MNLSTKLISPQVDFEKHYQKVLRDIRRKDELSPASWLWILEERKKYWGRNYIYSDYPENQFQKMEKLNPKIGFDWKGQRGNRKPIIEWSLEIRESLISKKRVEDDQYEWLIRNRKKYQDDPDSFSEQDINALDKLIPYLGRDWRQTSNYAAFLKFVKGINYSLSRDKKLSSAQVVWLNHKAQTFRNLSPEEDTHEYLPLLEKLNKYLEYGWRAGNNGVDFSQKAEAIQQSLEERGSITGLQKRWLNFQSKFYNADRLTEKQIEKLEHCTKKLLFDWKSINKKK